MLIFDYSMNKYIFPGADASLPLGWVIKQVSISMIMQSCVAVVDSDFSSNPQTLKSSLSTSSASTTLRPCIGGTSIGSLTRTRLWRNTVSVGIESGFTSWRIP